LFADTGKNMFLLNTLYFPVILPCRTAAVIAVGGKKVGSKIISISLKNEQLSNFIGQPARPEGKT
jgi:hypothetical protein